MRADTSQRQSDVDCHQLIRPPSPFVACSRVLTASVIRLYCSTSSQISVTIFGAVSNKLLPPYATRGTTAFFHIPPLLPYPPRFPPSSTFPSSPLDPPQRSGMKCAGAQPPPPPSPPPQISLLPLSAQHRDPEDLNPSSPSLVIDRTCHRSNIREAFFLAWRTASLAYRPTAMHSHSVCAH